MNMHYKQEQNMFKPKVFADMIGVSVKTLQRWDVSGALVANRTPTGRRYYTYGQYESYRGKSDGIEPLRGGVQTATNELFDRIATGDLSRHAVFTTESYYKLYCKNMEECDRLFDACEERQVRVAAENILRSSFGTERPSVHFLNVHMIGHGKPYRADDVMVAKDHVEEAILPLYEGEDHEVFASSDDKHPLMGYNDEEFVIISREGYWNMSMRDWIFLLDSPTAEGRSVHVFVCIDSVCPSPPSDEGCSEHAAFLFRALGYASQCGHMLSECAPIPDVLY